MALEVFNRGKMVRPLPGFIMSAYPDIEVQPWKLSGGLAFPPNATIQL